MKPPPIQSLYGAFVAAIIIIIGTLLCGCAGLQERFMPKPDPDPNAGAAEAAEASALSYVTAYTNSVLKNPMASMDDRQVVKYITEAFPAALKNLKAHRVLYKENPQANTQGLKESQSTVERIRDLADIKLKGVLDRNRGDTFAPPIMPIQQQPVTLLDPNVLAMLHQLKELQEKQLAAQERGNALLVRMIRGTNAPAPPVPGTTNIVVPAVGVTTNGVADPK